MSGYYTPPYPSVGLTTHPTPAPPPKGWQTEEDKARYYGFVNSQGRVDLDAFRRAVAPAPKEEW